MAAHTLICKRKGTASLRILMIGDIISQVGCDFLRRKLPQIKLESNVDFVVANGENSAVGNGILPTSAEFILDCGVDVITTGNHVFKRFEIQNYLDEHPQVIRPANFPGEVFGNGYYLYDAGSYTIGVVSLLGTSYMEPLMCPFKTMDLILEEISQRVGGCKYILVDFHAEATGEKKALAYYLDGRVSAVVGTHTHVQTADEQILDKGTGFITDLGMTGPYKSVLGVNPNCVINRLKTHLPTRFEVADSACQLEGVLLDLSSKTGLCEKITRVQVK